LHVFKILHFPLQIQGPHTCYIKTEWIGLKGSLDSGALGHLRMGVIHHKDRRHLVVPSRHVVVLAEKQMDLVLLGPVDFHPAGNSSNRER